MGNLINERYSRQTMLREIGEEGQSKLANSAVLIVGLGGLGAPVATYLAGAGVGKIGLCDADVVSLSNLQRQTLYSEVEVGRLKTSAAAQRLKSLNSSLQYVELPEGLTAKTALPLIANYDCVVDCTDNIATRLVIEQTCAALHKPWVHGSIGEFCGIVTSFSADSALRYSEIFAIEEPSTPQQVGGVVGAVPGVIGSIQAMEVIKILADFGSPLFGELLSVDLLNNNFEILTIN